MAKCALDIDEPKLVIIGKVAERDLRAGLETLRDKVAQDHKASMYFNHPMPGFPDYYNKVWEWDLKPAGDRSFTRPGWRLLAYVPNPDGPEPIQARSFVCWDKAEAPKNNQEQFIANALKKFLVQNVEIQVEEDPFIVRVDGQGRQIATCQLCWDVLIANDRDELDLMTDAHKPECRRHPPE